jgi:hypothetical protein
MSKVIHNIAFEGMDKTGKDIIYQYVKYLGNCQYILMDRGIISNVTYARIYNRNYNYDINQFKDWLLVYLYCDENDWNIRCKLSNEPKINYQEHLKEFNNTVDYFKNNNFNVLTINTSHITPYDAALLILKEINHLNS